MTALALPSQHVVLPEWGLLPRQEFWVTTVDAPWEIGAAGSGWWTVLPRGFETDIATIPWWGRTIVKPDDPRIAFPASLHDWLLRQRVEQRFAAGEFYRALRLFDVQAGKARLMYLAVVAASDEW